MGIAQACKNCMKYDDCEPVIDFKARRQSPYKFSPTKFGEVVCSDYEEKPVDILEKIEAETNVEVTFVKPKKKRMTKKRLALLESMADKFRSQADKELCTDAMTMSSEDRLRAERLDIIKKRGFCKDTKYSVLLKNGEEFFIECDFCREVIADNERKKKMLAKTPSVVYNRSIGYWFRLWHLKDFYKMIMGEKKPKIMVMEQETLEEISENIDAVAFSFKRRKGVFSIHDLFLGIYSKGIMSEDNFDKEKAGLKYMSEPDNDDRRCAFPYDKFDNKKLIIDYKLWYHLVDTRLLDYFKEFRIFATKEVGDYCDIKAKLYNEYVQKYNERFAYRRIKDSVERYDPANYSYLNSKRLPICSSEEEPRKQFDNMRPIIDLNKVDIRTDKQRLSSIFKFKKKDGLTDAEFDLKILSNIKRYQAADDKREAEFWARTR